MLQEAEKPKPDPLYGLRVHAWVLVLSGKREVPESFYIDPFTGRSYDTRHEHFLGIESVWNHRNYWVNMQDCWNGCKVLPGGWVDAWLGLMCTVWSNSFPPKTISSECV